MSKDTDFVLERVDNPSKETIDEYVSKSRPFILTNYATQWPAYKLWKDPNYLIQKVGADHEIPVRTHFTKIHLEQKQLFQKPVEADESNNNNNNVVDNNSNNSQTPKKQVKKGYGNAEWLGETATLPFKIFMEHWLQYKQWTEEKDLTEEFYYLASLPMNKHFQTLMDDVIVPPHPKEQKKSGNLWIGNSGQLTPVHYDFSTGDPGMDGLHAVLMGKKIFKLFDPQYNAEYFPRKNIWGRFHQAIVDVGGLPNPQEYPQFKNAKYVEIELNEGEMLFIPKLWWHHVETIEPSISVNFWFQHLGSEKLKLTRHWVAMEQYLMSIEKMEITPEKMRNVLQFYGYKNLSDEQVQYYMDNVHEFMLLPEFIATFSNGTRAPWMISDDSKQFGEDLCNKVKEWVLARKSNNNNAK